MTSVNQGIGPSVPEIGERAQVSYQGGGRPLNEVGRSI